MNELTSQQRFLENVKNHNIEIIRDDEINRHIRFKANHTFDCYFDLITWTGYLCITGDCGTYVFSRDRDMFTFFKSSSNKINPRYWGEKLESIDFVGGFKEFCKETFENNIKEYFEEYWRDTICYIERDKCWQEIEETILCEDNVGNRAMALAYDFYYKGFAFEDFYEENVERYTCRYLWNLHAIVWGINKYDEFKWGTK